MLSWVVVVIIATIIVVGHTLLLRSAWRFRKVHRDLPVGVPRSDPRGEIGWTLLSALGTVGFFALVFQSLL